MSKLLISSFLVYFMVSLSNAEEPTYAFRFVPHMAIVNDAVLEIVKIENGIRTTLSPSKEELKHLLSRNSKIATAFDDYFGNKRNFIFKLDNKSEPIYYSEFQLIDLIHNYNPKINTENATDEKQHCGRENSLLTINSWSDSPSEDYISKAGENNIIFAGSILHYKSFTVEANSTVTINDGRQKITQIKSDGDCNIHGKIISQKFRSESGSFSETSPDGEVLKVNIQEVNKGGKGGRGGAGNHGACIRIPTIPGGTGSPGTIEFGGGGGGASRIFLNANKCMTYSGHNSSGQIGGNSDWPKSFGGDGGGRTPKRNGGYLFIKCMGKINLDGAEFDFRGETGVNGQPGGEFGGGGGGGGPGGQGGVLFFNNPPSSTKGTKLLFQGGNGGFGGKGGGGDVPLDMGRPPGPGSENSRGEDGSGGEAGFSGGPELPLTIRN